MGIVLRKDEIRRRREALALSQSEAAKAAGFSTLQQWSNLERGQSSERPAAETMLRLARALRCKVEDLMDLDDMAPVKGKGRGKAKG